MEFSPTERRKRGRPWKTWIEGVQTAMATRNLEPDQWRNREEWNLVCGRQRQLLWNGIDWYRLCVNLNFSQTAKLECRKRTAGISSLIITNNSTNFNIITILLYLLIDIFEHYAFTYPLRHVSAISFAIINYNHTNINGKFAETETCNSVYFPFMLLKFYLLMAAKTSKTYCRRYMNA